MGRMWKAAVGLGMLAMVAGCSSQEQDTFRIGVAGPVTGAYAAFGEQLLKGATQAAEDINAAGGINGKMIKVVKGDDACEPKQAVALANRLVDSAKVQAVIGHFCSSSTLPASEVYAEAGILNITPASTNPQVTERDLKTVFRTCGRDDQQGLVAAEYMVKDLESQRIAVLHDKATYGQGLADAMKAHLHTLGQEEVLYEGLTRGEKDFNALVTKLKSVNADGVYFGGLHGEAGPLVRQIREQGLDIPFVSGDGIVSEEFILAAGGNTFAKGVYFTFGADPRAIPEGKKVVEKFRQDNYEPEGYTLYSYATMELIAKAIGATGSTDGMTLANWLRDNSVATVTGVKAFDAKGDLKESGYVMYRWNDKGSYDQLQ